MNNFFRSVHPIRPKVTDATKTGPSSIDESRWPMMTAEDPSTVLRFRRASFNRTISWMITLIPVDAGSW